MGARRDHFTVIRFRRRTGWLPPACGRAARLGLLALAALARTAWASAATESDFVPFHRYLYRGWSTEAGLPQISVYALARERDGRMWVGTENGLARFDGTEFEDRSADLRAVVNTTWVTALLRDSRDRLWVGTIQGVAQEVDNALRAAPAPGPAPIGKVNALAESRARQVCAAAESGVWCEDGSGALVPSQDWRGEATALLGTPEGMWIAGPGRLIHRSASAPDESVELPPSLRGSRINALALRADQLWVASTAGLWRLRAGIFSEIALVDAGPASPEVRALTVDPQGMVWAGTLQALYRIRDTQVLERIDKEGLHGLGNVITLRAEPDGSLWLGSQQNGLQHVWHANTEQLGSLDGLGNQSLWTYLPDGDGLLIGTDDGVWRYRGGRFSQVVPGKLLPSPVAYSLQKDERGRLYVGTRAGLMRFDAAFRPEHRFAELATRQINSIEAEPGGSVWLGTSGGLFRVDGDRAVSIGSDSGLDSPRVRSLLRDRDGMLWVGTEGGLFRREGERFARVPEPGPARQFTMTLKQLGDGRLLAGTFENGLFLRDGDGWRHFGASDGLPGESVFFLTEHAGTVIVGHRGGVYRLKVDQFRRDAPRPLQPDILLYDAGRLPESTYVRCCNGGGSGRGVVFEGFVWAASLGGAVRVALDAGVPEPPATALQRVQPARLLKSPRVGVVLDAADKRDIDLHYGAMDFREAVRLRYRYRLMDFDPDWVDAGRRRAAFYTNLPAGAYRFEVQAKREHEPWGPLLTIPVRVTPALTERLPFRVALVAAGLAALGLLLRLREAAARARQARLEAVVAERTAELSAANERLETLNEALAAASVTDPLTGLHNRRFILEQIGSVVANLRRSRVRSGEDRVMGVCVVDIDHFKRVNDDFGHETGDRVLKRIAIALRREMRDGDYLLRWGGEEFVVITSESRRQDLKPIAERLRAAVETSSPSPGEPERITVSVGYATYPLPGHSLEDHVWLSAMSLADHALYGAKAAGRNRIATVELHGSARDEMPDHLSAARLSELFAAGHAHLDIGSEGV